MKIAIKFLVIIFLSSCAEKTVFRPYNQEIISKVKKQLTYLALGDSYTIGEGVSLTSSFPFQLSNAAGTDSTQILSPKIIARTGWTTDELLNAIKSQTLEPRYDMVTLLIGVNNQYRNYPIATYRTEFVQLLNIAIEKAGNQPNKVFVLSIPDWGVTPFAQGGGSRTPQKIAEEIDAYNAINKQESEKLKVNYLDITAISRQAATDQSLLANDRLHPSALMYQLWVQQLAPLVKAKIN